MTTQVTTTTTQTTEVSNLANDFQLLQISEDSIRDQVHAALKNLKNPFEVISITVTPHNGMVDVERDLRNITSSGPRSYWDTTELIDLNEEDHDLKSLRSGYTERLELACHRFKESIIAIRQLYELHPTKRYRYTLNIRDLKNATFTSHVTQCLVGDYDKVTFCGRYRKQLSYEQMDFLFKTIKPEAYFEFNCEVPDGFQHEKAFQFNSVFYHHAEWVTLNDLKSLRNRNVVRLGSTNFISEDINEFLLYWEQCDEDMMNTFSVHLKPPHWELGMPPISYNTCDEKKILKNLNAVLKRKMEEEDEPRVCYIKPKGTRAVGQLTIRPEMIEFEVLTPLAESFQQVDHFFKDIQERSDLIAEKSSSSKELLEYELALDGSTLEEQDIMKEKIKRIEERRKEIDSIIDGMRSQWEQHGLEENQYH